ncbi:hypothetical protein HPB48_022300 [Haemaphysalis longicornis]|uniref:TRAF1-6 MATH domain-containing protein n=1 Tax=Haemaphysalis longicornis TaxID=44386 RepID=A0A9J6FPQ7_HAELO|nr:hypothetical protein HPB48_022300 [Haemaphysalis longicornis]
MEMSSMRAELKEMSRSLKIGAAATISPKGTGGRSLETGAIEDLLSQMRIQMAKMKDQLGEFMQNVYANQQTFHNSFEEKIEALKQSLNDTVLSRIIQSKLVPFREAMGDEQRATKADFDQLSLEINRQYNRMSELLRRADSNQEARIPGSQEGTDSRAQRLAETACAIAWAKNSTAEDHRNALDLLSSIMPVAATHTWTLEGYEVLKKQVQQQTAGVEETLEPVYLRGYRASVGVEVYYEFQKILVYLTFELHKGKMDRYLEWPFNLQIKWSILHPQGTQTVERCLTPSRVPHYKNSFLRPVEGSTRRIVTCGNGISVECLETPGYIKDDRLLLR